MKGSSVPTPPPPPTHPLPPTHVTSTLFPFCAPPPAPVLDFSLSKSLYLVDLRAFPSSAAWVKAELSVGDGQPAAVHMAGGAGVGMGTRAVRGALKHMAASSEPSLRVGALGVWEHHSLMFAHRYSTPHCQGPVRGAPSP